MGFPPYPRSHPISGQSGKHRISHSQPAQVHGAENGHLFPKVYQASPAIAAIRLVRRKAAQNGFAVCSVASPVVIRHNGATGHLKNVSCQKYFRPCDNIDRSGGPVLCWIDPRSGTVLVRNSYWSCGFRQSGDRDCRFTGDWVWHPDAMCRRGAAF